jgi:hypothetical protein
VVGIIDFLAVLNIRAYIERQKFIRENITTLLAPKFVKINQRCLKGT